MREDDRRCERLQNTSPKLRFQIGQLWYSASCVGRGERLACAGQQARVDTWLGSGPTVGHGLLPAPRAPAHDRTEG
jgi:hypothetical protein